MRGGSVALILCSLLVRCCAELSFPLQQVQASIAANTYVVSGPSESKKLEELLPGIITQLGPDNLNDLKKIYQSFAAGAGAKGAKGDEDDVPDLVDTDFESVSKAEKK